MSHEATAWAVKVRGITPVQKIALWHLANRHNPDYGCFPAQATLAHDAEVSLATLNRALAALEQRGLIRRQPRINPETGRQLSTRYLLACEPGFVPRPGTGGPDPDFGPDEDLDPAPGGGEAGSHSESRAEKGADSGPSLNLRDGSPSLISGEARLSFCESNLVKEESNTAGAPAGAHAPASAEARVDDPAPDVESPFDAEAVEVDDSAPIYPPSRTGLELASLEARCLGALGSRIGAESRALVASSREVIGDWLDDGVSLESDVLPALRSVKVPPRLVSWAYFSERVRRYRDQRLKRESRGEVEVAPDAPVADPLRKWAEWVNGDRFLAPSAVSNSLRNALLDAGLVTEARLRERGIA